MSRAHNDSNVLVIGGRVTGSELALSILKTWLDTPFEGGRHQRRSIRSNNAGDPPSAGPQAPQIIPEHGKIIVSIAYS